MELHSIWIQDLVTEFMLCGAQQLQLFSHLMMTMMVRLVTDDNDDAAVAAAAAIKW